MVEIVTERLNLRPFQVDDLEAFVAYRSDPEVARYQSWDRTYSRADAESFLRSQRDLTFGQPGEWQGLATEALEALLTELFEQRGTHRLFAEVDDRNVPVQRLLDRLGFRCEARLVEADWFKGEWSTLRLYATLDREWGEHQNAQQSLST